MVNAWVDSLETVNVYSKSCDVTASHSWDAFRVGLTGLDDAVWDSTFGLYE